MWEREEMEHLLGELCGHLGMMCWTQVSRSAYHRLPVIYPNRFLEGEDVANNFLFNADR
jgi:phospholipase D1/2